MHGQIASGAWSGQGRSENKQLSHLLRKTWESESEVRVLTLTLRGRSRVYGEVCEAASIHYLLLLGTPLTNKDRGYWHGVEPNNGALGRRLLKHVWNSGVIKPMNRDVASLTNQQFLTLYGTEDNTECLDKK